MNPRLFALYSGKLRQGSVRIITIAFYFLFWAWLNNKKKKSSWDNGIKKSVVATEVITFERQGPAVLC